MDHGDLWFERLTVLVSGDQHAGGPPLFDERVLGFAQVAAVLKTQFHAATDAVVAEPCQIFHVDNVATSKDNSRAHCRRK